MRYEDLVYVVSYGLSELYNRCDKDINKLTEHIFIQFNLDKKLASEKVLDRFKSYLELFINVIST